MTPWPAAEVTYQLVSYSAARRAAASAHEDNLVIRPVNAVDRERMRRVHVVSRPRHVRGSGMER